MPQKNLSEDSMLGEACSTCNIRGLSVRNAKIALSLLNRGAKKEGKICCHDTNGDFFTVPKDQFNADRRYLGYPLGEGSFSKFKLCKEDTERYKPDVLPAVVMY